MKAATIYWGPIIIVIVFFFSLKCPLFFSDLAFLLDMFLTYSNYSLGFLKTEFSSGHCLVSSRLRFCFIVFTHCSSSPRSIYDFQMLAGPTLASATLPWQRNLTCFKWGWKAAEDTQQFRVFRKFLMKYMISVSDWSMSNLCLGLYILSSEVNVKTDLKSTNESYSG